MSHSVEREIEGRVLRIETGKVAKQAAGSVTVQYHETVVLSAVCSGPARPGLDPSFLPLTVDYREKGYAAGLIFGGRFYRREGRPTEKEILTMRLTDRPIRPLFPSTFRDEILISGLVLSADPDNEPDVLSITGAAAALELSPLPFEGPMAACRVGLVDGKLKAFPTHGEMAESSLNIVVASKPDGVVMVEAGAREVAEEDVIRAIEYGRKINDTICEMIRELAEKVRPDKMTPEEDPVPSAADELLPEFAEALRSALITPTKQERHAALDAVREEFMLKYAASEEGEEGKMEPGLASLVFEEIHKRVIRNIILEGRRVDGRAHAEIRDISCEVGLLPRTHGSALFTRGETQALVTTTLGTAEDEQLYEGLTGERAERFLLHYNFPSFSVGEVKPPRGPSRREIGHGALARRAVESLVPNFEEFPYVVRVVSDILESNGSSSMATVCGASLSLMDAGVPIKDAVAGIAMGLIVEGDRTAILSDILGDEDHYGDMDFKVAGTRNGITALQMDIKVPGISSELMGRALEQAREGRLHILDIMERTISEPRPEIAEHAPRILQMMIPVEKIGKVIGPAGTVIKKLEEESGADISIEDSGLVCIYASDTEKAEKARAAIEKLVEVPVIGKIYQGTVKGIKDFGVFVEIIPGVEGLVHVSELSSGYIENVNDFVKMGDTFPVKLLSIDDHDRLRLSRKAAEEELGITPPAPPEASSQDGQGKQRHRSTRGKGGRDSGKPRGGNRSHRPGGDHRRGGENRGGGRSERPPRED